MRARLPKNSDGTAFATANDRLLPRWPCLLLIVSCAGLAAPASYASQWTVQPEISIGAAYNDNPRLIEDGTEDSIFGGALGLATSFRWRTEISEVQVRPRANIGRFPDDEEEDYEDLFLDFSAAHKTQKSTWLLAVNVSDQKVLRGEVESADFDDTGVDDAQTGTGQVQNQQDRTLLYVTPGVTYRLSERSTWLLDASYLDVSYEPEISGLAVDYTNGQVGTGLSYELSPQTNVKLQLTAGEYETGNNLNTTSFYGANVRIEMSASERSNFYFEVGYQDSDIEVGVSDPTKISESTFNWDVGYVRRWTRTNLRLAAGESVTPSGAGFLTERQRFRAILEHDISQRWRVGIAAIAQATDTLASDSDFGDRDYLQGRFTLGYQISRKWSLEGEIRLTDQDDKDEPGSAQSTQANLLIVYRPPLAD